MNLIAESEPSTSATQTAAYEYVWFAGAPVAQIDTSTSTTHWTFTDHLGTPQLQTNAAGATDWRAEYEPYGSVFAYRSGATRHQPLRFPGQEYDETVPNREYNIFRWYQGGWGRYTQADPIGNHSDWNLYRYAFGNPERFFDPKGLKTCCTETSDYLIRLSQKLFKRSQDILAHRGIDLSGGGQVIAETFCGTGNNGKGVPMTDFQKAYKKLGKCEQFCVRAHEAVHGWICREFDMMSIDWEHNEGLAYSVEARCLADGANNGYVDEKGFSDYAPLPKP